MSYSNHSDKSKAYDTIVSMNSFLQGVNDRIEKMNLVELESRATNQLAKDALKKFELFSEAFETDELEHLMDEASYQQLSKNVKELRRFVSTDSYMTIYHPDKGLTLVKEENKRVGPKKELPRCLQVEIDRCNWRMDAAMDELMLFLEKNREAIEGNIGKERVEQLVSHFKAFCHQIEQPVFE